MSFRESKYAEYGFSLDVPIAMHGQVHGHSWQGTASETSGLVQFTYDGAPYDSVGVQWETVESTPDLPADLEEFLEVLRGLGLEVEENGQLVSTAIGDHELVYKPVEINDGERTTSAVIGSLYCEKARRVHILYYANLLELTEWIDPLTEFQHYIDSFTCF